MNRVSVSIEIPRDLLGVLGVPRDQLKARLSELIAVELFREGKISSGKGAELLGVSRLDFIRMLAKRDIPYFTQSSDELADEIREIDSLLNENRG